MKQISDNQKDAFNRKLTGVLIIVIGIVLIFGVAILARFGDLAIVRKKLFNNNSAEKSNYVKISGTPTCLKYKPKYIKEQSSKCNLGIKTSDNEYYAISGGTNPLDLYGEIGASEFEVSGTLIEAGSDEKYDIVGTITIE